MWFLTTASAFPHHFKLYQYIFWQWFYYLDKDRWSFLISEWLPLHCSWLLRLLPMAQHKELKSHKLGMVVSMGLLQLFQITRWMDGEHISNATGALTSLRWIPFNLVSPYLKWVHSILYILSDWLLLFFLSDAKSHK